jgi:tetratricopeptide (TPR) repeat protein
MPTAFTSIELEVRRIRELSKSGRHGEALAEAQMLAAEAPGNRDILYLMAANLRCLNRISEALAVLQQLEQQHPQFSLLYQERGYCYVTLRDASRAIEAFLRAVTINPALGTSWRMLQRLYDVTGDARNATTAAGQASMLNRLPPDVVRAGSLFSEGDLSAAETILRTFLRDSEDAEAMRLLARIERRRDALDEAELRLESALELEPDYRAARLDYARVLLDRQKYPQAREEIETLVSLDPGNSEYVSLQAAAHSGLGDHETAVLLYRRLLAASPDAAEMHILLGHSLKALGRQREATACYRRAVAIRPSFGDAYWSLANLKTYRFSEDEIERMRVEQAAPAAQPFDRIHLCFALGKALEDRYEFAESWQFYARGNALKRAGSRYEAEITETNARRQIEVCIAPFFAVRKGFGAPNPDPIFIVGLPRSGSTLIEQILASHSQIEGTQELADVQRIVLEFERGQPVCAGPPSPEPRYRVALTELTQEDYRRLGERYLADTRAYRNCKPFFIDKMPNNFRHIGLIHLMLPNAKIIDVRREPMACCFSNLKQLFARGQEFTYGIEDIARYCRTYLDLMRHWDAVLPGRVLRVCYEDVVENLEASVRRLLEFFGLGFEPACVEFYKTQRSVRTASSEQVRLPIFREGLSQWRNYQPWLGPLQDALGDARMRYRE